MLGKYLRNTFMLRLFVPIVGVLCLSTIGLVLGVVTYQKSILKDMERLVVCSLDRANKETMTQFNSMRSDFKKNLSIMTHKAGDVLSKSTTKALENEKSTLARQWEDTLRENANSLALLLARVAPPALISNNFLDLLSYTRSATKNPNIVYALYFNKDGKPMTRYLNKKNPLIKKYLKEGKGKNKIQKVLDASQRDPSVFIIEKPIKLEDKLLGNVTLCVSKKSSQKKIEEMSGRFLALDKANTELISSVLGEQTKKMVSHLNKVVNKMQSKSDALLKNIREHLVGSCNALVDKMWKIIAAIGAASLALVISILLPALSKMSKGINRIAFKLREEAENVVGAAAHVSAASQSLAEGASEQASSIEETSSSLEEMSSITKQNAENAQQANGLMKKTMEVVGRASESMTNLNESMKDISKAAEQTSKIIKTIDEIAFQTNLLALNAAVEAARAGEAGAGFAVVADEVRNLAIRAAEAARNTAGLIEETVRKVAHGLDFTNSTTEAFTQVGDGANRVAQLVDEIAIASKEQAQGIEQVNTAVGQMDKIVQQNAASAEQTASTSEQMNAQAVQLKAIVAELMSLVGGKEIVKEPSQAPGQVEKESTEIKKRIIR